MIREKTYSPQTGWLYLALCLVLLLGIPALFIWSAVSRGEPTPLMAFGLVVSLATGCICLFGLIAVPPNEARVLLLFGEYKGTVRTSGFYWVNPFFSKKKISLRIRNFETGTTSTAEVKDAVGTVVQPRTRTAVKPSKVNDRDGNPIEISAVVVWKVVDTAEAMFEVDDYEHFVEVQSEAALRSLASRHPYDCDDENISLRGNTIEISNQLRQDIQERLDKAGVESIEARISHLAYAPEIAAAMLQRQQAHAVVAARTKIVEGAVGMVEMALEQIAKDNLIEMNDDRRAAMVSNLLVVLCSDRHAQPVVNTGSIYQ
jgi:regulator of protease activity HflC (stomatin/prohibitin superfamily)